VLTSSGSGAVFVFGGAGDDTISALSALGAGDLIDGGTGTDTLILNAANENNAMVMRSIENVTINGSDIGVAQTFTNDNSASAIKYINAVAASVVNLADLSAGSTVRIESAADTTNKTAAVTVGFKNAEASSTVDIASGMGAAALTLSNITNATVNFGAATGGNAAINTTDVTSLTLNASKAFESSAIGSTNDKLKSVVINGSDAVKTTTIGGGTTTNSVEAVNITGKSVSVTTIGADTDTRKLTTVQLSATDGALSADAIGIAANTNVLSVALAATGNISGTTTPATSLAIASTKLGNISAQSSTGTVEIGVIGADATEIGNVTLAGKGNVTAGLIGKATAIATMVGTINITSADGNIVMAGTNSISTKDATGLTVNLSAKGTIAAAGGAAVIKNEGGNINASLAGEAKATVNFTAVTKGIVNLAASNTGGLVSTLTQAGTAGDGSVSTVSLGNAKTGEVNALTVTGIVDTLNITGGTGADTVVLAQAQNLATGTVALGSGTNILSFAGTTGGVAVNLGSSTVTFTDTGSTTVAAGRAVGFDNASASSKVVTGAAGFNLTLSGISEVVGTASADYIVANAQGTTITGGGGNDTIVLGAGNDKVVFGTAATNGSDTIMNFTTTSDKLVVAGTGSLLSAIAGTAFVAYDAEGTVPVTANSIVNLARSHKAPH
jgi:hypothetical protein